MALFYPHDMAVSKNGGYNKNAHFHGKHDDPMDGVTLFSVKPM